MSEIELPSGRTIIPNLGIIGIDEEGDLYEGYDSYLRYHRGGDDLEPMDAVYIADLMIMRWVSFKAMASVHQPTTKGTIDDNG